MTKLIAQVLPIAITLLAIACLSCDDYNIVEPRFYSEDEVVEFPICGDDTLKLSGFSVDACWRMGPERVLAMAWRTLDSGSLKVTILNSAGAVEIVVHDGPATPGIIVVSRGVPWGDREDGVYAISLQTERATLVVWFEVN